MLSTSDKLKQTKKKSIKLCKTSFFSQVKTQRKAKANSVCVGALALLMSNNAPTQIE